MAAATGWKKKVTRRIIRKGEFIVDAESCIGKTIPKDPDDDEDERIPARKPPSDGDLRALYMEKMHKLFKEKHGESCTPSSTTTNRWFDESYAACIHANRE